MMKKVGWGNLATIVFWLVFLSWVVSSTIKVHIWLPTTFAWIDEDRAEKRFSAVRERILYPHCMIAIVREYKKRLKPQHRRGDYKHANSH